MTQPEFWFFEMPPYPVTAPEIPPDVQPIMFPATVAATARAGVIWSALRGRGTCRYYRHHRSNHHDDEWKLVKEAC